MHRAMRPGHAPGAPIREFFENSVKLGFDCEGSHPFYIEEVVCVCLLLYVFVCFWLSVLVLFSRLPLSARARVALFVVRCLRPLASR